MKKAAIPADFPYKSNYVDVLGSKMHYIEEGEGDPILFLHGVPTSSYVWRNVIPHLASLGRCIAPDLMGFGKSDKPDIEYTINDHIRYIENFIESLNLSNVTLVMHGWGSIVGFDYAMRHEKNIKGLVFYEAYLRPQNGDDVSLPYHEQLEKWQGRDTIHDLVANGVQFVDEVITQGTMRKLSDKELRYYREPFLEKGSHKPLHQYLRDTPHGNEKNQVNNIIAEYSKKLTKSSVPKLMLYSVPGFITTISTVMWAKEHLPQLEMIEIGEELHYAQESDPELMAQAISAWVQGI